MMSPQPDNSHAVKRVVLPSGKTIEIVYFAEAAERVERAETRISDLHVCPDCSSGLVYPLAWDEAGDQAWELLLRCPNCEWQGEGVFAQHVVEQLDEQLDYGTQVLVRDLRQLMHANMEDEVERFIAALNAGHILPMDF
jgi:ribosomal protein L37AE/L43A